MEKACSTMYSMIYILKGKTVRDLLMMKIFVCLLLLILQRTLARPYIPGVVGVREREEMMDKQSEGEEPVGWLWSEDYTPVHSRRYVHNELEP